MASFVLTFVPAVVAQRAHDVYRTPGDKTQNSYRAYEVNVPPLGLVALLPMFGGDLDSFATASLPKILARRGVMTVIIAPTPQYTGYLDDPPLVTLNEIVAEVAEKYRIAPGRFVIGGMSAGGTGAVRFAQHCAVHDCHPSAKPVAIFAVDAPLDFERWWRSQEMSLRRASPKSLPQEANGVLGALRRMLGGSPTEKPDVYLRQSPLLASAPQGGNARLLKDVPVRLYTEPDIPWRIEKWGSDYYTSNVVDQAALVLQLQILGNAKAELITTSGRGYRADGERNPHSWSIVDEPKLAEWIVAQFRRGGLAGEHDEPRALNRN